MMIQITITEDDHTPRASQPINVPELLTSLTSSLTSLARTASSLSAQLANTRIAARNRHRCEAFFDEKMRGTGGGGGGGGGGGARAARSCSEVTARMLVWCFLTFEPLQKTVPGSGYALAKDLLPTTAASNNNNARCGAAPKPDAPLGAVPPDFRPRLTCYNDRAELFDLIEFYNESFGVVRGDEAHVIVEKLMTFLTT